MGAMRDRATGALATSRGKDPCLGPGLGAHGRENPVLCLCELLPGEVHGGEAAAIGIYGACPTTPEGRQLSIAHENPLPARRQH